MFRGKRTDGKGWVTGWLTRGGADTWWMNTREKEVNLQGILYTYNKYEVIPSTISMKTFQTDKNGDDIYGSFMLDGYGMTEGGDRVKHDAGDIWNVCIEDKEIDGYQCTGFWGFCKSEHNKIEIIKQEDK